MTVIVAVRRSDGGISMAADKRVTLKRGWRIPMADSKLGRVGGMVVGVCGSTAPGELLLSGRPPRRLPDQDALDYLRTRVGPWMRRRVAKAGLTDEDWGALVALDGRLFEMDEAAGVTEVNSDVWAVGSGKGLAVGAVLGWVKAGEPLRTGHAQTSRMLASAVEVASTFDTMCGDGCDIVHGDAP